MSKITRYRIGVLEDDALIAETLEDILETLGHQVIFLERLARFRRLWASISPFFESRQVMLSR